MVLVLLSPITGRHAAAEAAVAVVSSTVHVRLFVCLFVYCVCLL